MLSSVSPDARFRCNPRVLVREVAGEAVLLDLDRGLYFALNATGLRVWELAAEGRSFAAAVDALETEFEAAREQLETDAGDLLSDLEKAGLLLAANERVTAADGRA
jgi:hypothetical protein